MMAPRVSPSWSEGKCGGVLDEREYVAVRSQEVRGPYVAKGVRGPHVTMTYEEETACRQQPGLGHNCQVHATSSVDVEAAVRKFFRCGRLQALDPGSRWALALLTNLM